MVTHTGHTVKKQGPVHFGNSAPFLMQFGADSARVQALLFCKWG